MKMTESRNRCGAGERAVTIPIFARKRCQRRIQRPRPWQSTCSVKSSNVCSTLHRFYKRGGRRGRTPSPEHAVEEERAGRVPPASNERYRESFSFAHCRAIIAKPGMSRRRRGDDAPIRARLRSEETPPRPSGQMRLVVEAFARRGEDEWRSIDGHPRDHHADSDRARTMIRLRSSSR
jgi:hypothetical protein